jgi:uncharacterized protein (UPF0335 family)
MQKYPYVEGKGLTSDQLRAYIAKLERNKAETELLSMLKTILALREKQH